ncbi:hypothetical protein SAMN06297251_1344 [Fulvimarina manganoxydans]|uniref:Methyl-accepting chemotaxis protein n=1 Tax=Fulvimarina manganoxydans TaxID=937218 RepID=A0A1W2ETG3_9HYPH|nr:hypothetical protein [Fulvimarina manganoxydans]SMD13004.1 hypothetical protein SAMN06297251_1344 [Fulvimarina manganoxydans]
MSALALQHIHDDEGNVGQPRKRPRPLARSHGFADQSGRLDGTIAGIETIFLGIGESLINAVGLLSEMQAAFASVTEVHTSPELREAETAIRVLVGESDHLLANMASERALIGKLLKSITAARPRIDELRQTVAMISAIAVNARVIVAGMRHDGHTELSVFTDDVLNLARRAGTVVDRLHSGQARLRALLVDASSRSESFERTFREGTAHLSERIDADLKAAVKDRNQAASVSLSAKEASTGLSQQASTIVASMQIGDNTRQRLEHISAALRLADEHPDAASTILDLQCAQMEGTRDKLIEEARYMQEAIIVLSRDIDDAFTALSRDLSGNKGKDAPGAGRLSADLSKAAEELSRSEAEHGHIEALAGSIGENVATFQACSDEMRQLEFEMRLVSLNTAISCSQLGTEGIALGVVSLQMRELVGEMVARSETVASALSELGTIADDLGRVRADAAERSIAKLVGDAEHSQTFLTTVEDRLAGAARELYDLGKRVADLSQDAGAALDRLGGILSELEDIETALKDEANSRDSNADAVIAETDQQELFAKLRKTYTMEGERQIHDRIVGGPSGDWSDDQGAAEDSAPASDDIDDFLF